MGANYFISTGRIIKDYLEEIEMSQKEFAKRLDISEKHISNFLSGKIRLTEEMAIKLEYIFTNIPASYWLNIETKYREYLARSENSNKLKKMDLKKIAKDFKFSEVFSGLNWSIEKQAEEMLKILKISDYNNFENAYSMMNANFFEDGGEKHSIFIWINLCKEQIEIQNNVMDITKFNIEALRKNLMLFKSISLNENVEESVNSCRKLCNKLGIYLVVRETISNSKVRGALITYKNNPAILLSGRFKTHDHIWFAFMHEIKHLLTDYCVKETLVSIDDSQELKEIEANKFARDFFINEYDYQKFISIGDFSPRAILKFKTEQGTTEGIVIGRLQHDGYLNTNQYNYKKSK